MIKLFKLFFLLILLTTSSIALDKIYFLPKEVDEAKNKILKLINNANHTIDIAMYSLDYKKFYKALKKASKNGIDITIINGKSKLKFYKKIRLIQTKRKQHIKLAIIDNKYAIFGSANWKKESFGENYEILNITDEKKKVNRFIEIFKELKQIEGKK